MHPENFTRETAGSIRVGDRVHPDPLWNQTERPKNRMPKVATVDGIRTYQSQTGRMLLVCKRWLDAGWFRRAG